MSAVAVVPLAADVLAHLDAQLRSARRLFAHMLAQGAAIRARDVDAVLATMSEIQAEMTGRETLERDRTQLLARAGAALGINAAAVTLERMTELMDAADADAARALSAELRGLLAEIAREHALNRALMRQELAFLEHLTRLIGGSHDTGAYGRPGPQSSSARATLHVLDLEA